MDLMKVLADTAEQYARMRIADVRYSAGDEDEALDYRGNVLSRDGKPLVPAALVIVQTSQPAAAIKIVASHGGASPDSRKLGMIDADTLDELAAMVRFRRGRCGILWLNAGTPRVLGGAPLANAMKAYDLSVEREDAGQSWPESSRVIQWSRFVEPRMARGKRGQVLMDWLAATGQLTEVEPQEDAADPAEATEGGEAAETTPAQPPA